MTITIEQAVHGQAARTPIDRIARYLQDLLGQRLTAVISGTADAKAIGKWARGERRPHPKAELRLRHAFQITQLLIAQESAETVRAWFIGMNPELDDESPALVIGKDPALVLGAAKSFIAHG